MKIGRMGVTFLTEGEGGGYLCSCMQADDLIMCGKSQEDLRAMVGHFVEVCRRIILEVSGDKKNMMALNGEEGLECEVRVDGMLLDHCIYQVQMVQCRRNVATGKKDVG